MYNTFDPDDEGLDTRDLREMIRRYETLLDFVRDLYFELDGTRPSRSWAAEKVEVLENLFDDLGEDL